MPGIYQGRAVSRTPCGAADLAAFQEGIQGRQLALGDHHRYDEEREILIWSNCGEREEIPVKVLLDDSARYYIGLVRFEEKN